MKQTPSWLCSLFLIVALVGLFAVPSSAKASEGVAPAGEASLVLDAETGAIVADAAAPAFDKAPAVAPAESPLGWTQSLIVIVTPMLVAGLKLLVPKIPKAFLPVAAAVVGALCSVVDHFATGADLNVWLGLGLGLAGVGLREGVKQMKAAASTPATT